MSANTRSSHAPVGSYVCDVCDKAFMRPSSLEIHKNATHIHATPVVCDWPGCNKRFTTEEYLRRHSQKHTDSK